MADMSTTNGKPKLPPLSAKTVTEEAAPKKKRVVKKKKKPAEDGETPKESTKSGDDPKPTPRKKKAASSSSTTEAGGETATPKKKKRVVKQTAEQEVDPSSARSAASQGEDVSGSKASLITKGTPRKKKAKKKVKKTPETGESTEFFDNALAQDLSVIKDDIITAEESKKEEKDYTQQMYSVASNIPRSMPTEKFYIETDRGFKGENKSKFAKRMAEEEAEKAIVCEEPKNTTIAFALRTHKVLRTIFLFFHGILAGFSVWHITMAYVLLEFGYLDFIEHYRALAMPVQCVFYLLLVICLVSSCDRFDIANPRRHFIIRAVTLQNGTISVVIYLVALILSLVNAGIEDKIYLYDTKPMLWNNTAQMDTDLTTWRNLNTARGSLSILGWFVLSLAPMADRLTKNLKEADDNLLGKDDEELGKA